MKWHKETVAILSEMGWEVDPFPLIWLKSDNAGMLPDMNRGPRRIYETALFASRGDRKIVRPVSNAVALPTTKDFHTSEKPLLVLQHFFRMFVDESTRLLDPTCGSGMAIRAAEEAGSSFALGLEMNEEFAERARVNCKL
jgi:DNA modification methylase